MNRSNSKESKSWSDRLRQLDHHTAVSSEYRVSTKSGAILSSLTILVLLYLIRTELQYNLTPTIRDRVHVNATTPAGIEVELDISFPTIPCALLAIDAEDPTGQAQSLHIDREHRIFKHRLDVNGQMIGHKSRFEIGGTVKDPAVLVNSIQNRGFVFSEKYKDASAEVEDEEECGSCYGAKGDDECCNTCDDVKRAYIQKGWSFDPSLDIKQCKHVRKSEEEEGEGCNIHGTVALSSGGGNLHIAPSHALENFGSGKESDGFNSLLEMLQAAFETYNVTHTIHKLRFGREFPGHVHPLDNQTRVVSDDHAMYQYYIQIVPTLYRFLNGTSIQTNQYSVTEHLRHVPAGSKRGLPGVFFFYEVSPLHVEFEEYVRGWIHFFTGVCAVVGGVFSFMSMLDGFLFAKMSARSGSGLG